MSVCDSILYFSGVLVYLNITVIIKTSISLESPPALLFIFKVILPILGPLHFYMPLETASQMPTQEKTYLHFYCASVEYMNHRGEPAYLYIV